MGKVLKTRLALEKCVEDKISKKNYLLKYEANNESEMGTAQGIIHNADHVIDTVLFLSRYYRLD
jgi:hypothetical protein